MAAHDLSSLVAAQLQGAVLVVLDMPVGTEFGIDYNSWNVGCVMVAFTRSTEANKML